MIHLLAILKEPERSAMRLDRLAGGSAEVRVDVVDDVAEAAELLEQTEVLVTIGPVLGADAATVFRGAVRLKWVQSIGVGVDNLLGHPALSPTVVVTNVRGVHGVQMSEAALSSMLAFAREVPRVIRNQEARRWERFAPALLAGSTVGIVGLGAISEALAPRCKALGMRVVGVSSSPREIVGFDQVVTRDALLDVAAELDFLVLLVPYSAQTHHLIDAAVLAALKPGAVLVNLARGGVLDENALLVALDANQLAGAALDVFASEPLPTDNPLWSHPKVLVTPHLGGFHRGYPDQVLRVIADNLARYRSGGTAALINRLN